MPYREPDAQALVRVNREADARQLALVHHERSLPGQRRRRLLRRIVETPIEVPLTMGGIAAFFSVLHLETIWPVWIVSAVAAVSFGYRLWPRDRSLPRLPFLVRGYDEALRRCWRVRLPVLFAHDPDVETITLAKELAAIFRDETLVFARGRHLVLLRQPRSGEDGLEWCRMMLQHVLGALHRVVPITEACIEESPTIFSVTLSAGKTSDVGSLYDAFVDLKHRHGEAADLPTFEGFHETVTKRAEGVMAKHRCDTVKLRVFVKEGAVVVQAVPVKA